MLSDGFSRVHGGVADGAQSADVLDLSVNVNPYGPASSVVRAVREAPIDRYPDPTARPARAALGARLGLSEDALVVGPGAVDLLWTIARAVLSPGDRVVVVEPAFCELRLAAESAGAEVLSFRLNLHDDFHLDVEALGALVRDTSAKLVYLASPSNPSGRLVSHGTLASLARFGAMVVLDESFLSLSTGHADLDAPLPPEVVRLRSVTKDHALAGLRVGYAIVPPELGRRMERSRPPWATSEPAQRALVATLGAGAFVAESRARLLSDRARQSDRLRAAGVRVLPSDTIYALAFVADARAFGERALREHGVLVRDCTSFGLPAFVRICARPERDDARVLAAFSESPS